MASTESPGNLQDTLRPLAESHTLPPACYSDPRFHAWETAHLLHAGWHCVGRLDSVPDPGDYLALDLAGVPLVLVRDEAGVVRCLSNVCRHRAMPLLIGEGNCQHIRCPFHGWTYRLTGELAGAPAMQNARDFDKCDYGLLAVRMAEQDGFLFVNVDGQAGELDAWLGDFSARHAAHALGDMRVTRRKRFDVACNWKLFLQVFMEYYHLPYVHGETLAETRYQAPASAADEVSGTGNYCSVFGEHEGTGALLQQPGVQSFDAIATLDERLARGTRYTHVFPSMAFAATRDCMWFYECYPQSVDHSVFYLNSCFPTATVAREDFAELAENYYHRWDIALAEDIAVLERQQRGVASPLARAGRASHLESAVSHFERWIAQRATTPD